MPNCTLSHDGDEYVVPGGQAGALLSASTFSTNESNINCAGYTEITGDVVWHEYTGTAPVLVKIHITRQEMKASSNNGQARVELCVGLLDDGALTGQAKWASLGVHRRSPGLGRRRRRRHLGGARSCVPEPEPGRIGAVHRPPVRRRGRRQLDRGVDPGRRPAPPHLIFA